MRTLTITRRRSSVACFATKSYVFIEDYECYDVFIDKIPCRLLGTVSNGGTEVFEIPSGEARVYVSYNKAGKGYSNDYYTVPDDNADVELSGRARFNPLTGNAFRFDAISDQSVVSYRRKCLFKGTIVDIFTTIAAVAAVFAVFAFIL